MNYKGKVKIIKVYGDDRFIAQAAGVCHKKFFDDVDLGTIMRRIQEMIKGGHTMPFEFVHLTFWIYAPLFVFNQFRTYRTGSFLCAGGRRNEPKDFYVPKQAGNEPEKTVEEREAMGKKYLSIYQQITASGYSKEQARCYMAQGQYVEFLMQIDMNNFLKMLAQRIAPNTQEETRAYALEMKRQAEFHFPITINAWQEFRPLTFNEIKELATKTEE